MSNNNISNLLPSVKPEFFSTPHAWELEEATGEKPQAKKSKPRPRKKSPSRTIKINQQIGSGVASSDTMEKVKSSSDKSRSERKAKKEIFLIDMQNRRKGNVEKIVQKSQADQKSSKLIIGKTIQSVESPQLPGLIPKPKLKPKMPKHSLFNNSDDWAEAPLDGQVEFDFSEIPKWD